MDAFYRNYLVRENNSVDLEVLERALESFEGVALKFSADVIGDANLRKNYNENVKRVKTQVLIQVNNGSLSAKEAAAFCYEMRNKIMAETRARTSMIGRAFAEKEKAIPPALEELLDDKSNKRFGQKFFELSGYQRSSIHYEIIEASARPSTKFNVRNKVLAVAGKVLVVVTVAYVVYDIASAENKQKEAIKQALVIGGGAFGVLIVKGLGSLVCGPGAPVCAIALLLAGGFAGGWGISQLAESIDDELEEFTKWRVK